MEAHNTHLLLRWASLGDRECSCIQECLAFSHFCIVFAWKAKLLVGSFEWGLGFHSQSAPHR